MGSVYVTHVADVDNGQCHEVALVCSFKESDILELILNERLFNFPDPHLRNIQFETKLT